VIFAVELVYSKPVPHHQRRRSIRTPRADRVPAALFPFARQIVADATRNGASPLMIDPMICRALPASGQAQASQPN
jgi:preprotein translocase subunit SecB